VRHSFNTVRSTSVEADNWSFAMGRNLVGIALGAAVAIGAFETRPSISKRGRPFVTDFQPGQAPQSCAFVIFGVTGDLTRRLIVPALYNLAAEELLPDKFCVVGVARHGISKDALCEALLKGVREFATRRVEDKIVNRLFECVTPVEADSGDARSFDRLKEQLEGLEVARNTGGNRLFYLATPPDAFAPIARELGRVGLLKEDGGAWRRLVVEKPFGNDLASARALNLELLSILNEHQIYRIDHYLGKETVQNILVLRFANGMFEPIWNRHHIDHVQITVEETLGIGHRGSFYDAVGALRDMVPNHLFQLLSLVAMEPPARFEAHSVRSEKGEVLAAIQTQSEEEALRNSVRGQYTVGKIGDTVIPAYRETEDVRPDSTTETYVALKLQIDNWRWAGVPFYLRTGKALSIKRTEVAIKFREAPLMMFERAPVEQLAENYLVIGIEPTEGVMLQFNTKVPGPTIRTSGVQMKFRYKDYFKAEPATGYETLIYDCLIGDNMLFQRADSIEAGWLAVQPILDAWKKAGATGLEFYPAGSEGPPGAFELLKRDGRSWRKL
jgi:glucose-6-phosphate 1-dehydrogenase